MDAKNERNYKDIIIVLILLIITQFYYINKLIHKNKIESGKSEVYIENLKSK